MSPHAAPSAEPGEECRDRSVSLFLMLTLSLSLVLFPALPAMGQTDPSGLKREAERHMDAGRFGEAISLMDKYITQRPSEADAYRIRGLCYQGRGQLEDAVQDFQRALGLDAGNAQVKSLLARAEKTLRDRTNQKIDGYKRELARNPAAAAPYLQIAQAYRTLQAWQEAEGWYDGYFKRTEGSPEEILRYCEILAKLSRLQKGEDLLEQSVRRFPQRADLQSRHGYFLLWQGKYQLSQKAFERALSLKPSLAEAQEGLEQARTAERAPRPAVTGAVRALPPVETSLDRSLRLLRSKPRDEEARFAVVQELSRANRFDEALRHLDTLAVNRADSLRVVDMRLGVSMRRDSAFRAQIEDFLEALKDEPENRALLVRVATAYGELGEYQSALDYLDRALKGVGETDGYDLKFRYAQYAAWGKYFPRALTKLTPLLRASPGNLDYHLLRGQIAVWSLQDLEEGIRSLNNVVRLAPGNVQGLIALSAALAQQGNFTAARDYLERARKLDPYSRDVQAARLFYQEALTASEQRTTYGLLESARELAEGGECAKAVRKYEEYMAKVPEPGKTILLAYADAQSCAKNQRKAIQVLDGLLEQEYDYDVAVTRAKYLLWGGDSLGALREFSRLSSERPSDFTAGLFLGESYQRLGRYTEARELYQGLLDRSKDEQEQTQVLSRMKFLPLTGAAAAFALLPPRLALSPPASYYSDNQEFSLANYGGRIELGVISILSIGGSYERSLLQSAASSRYYSRYKGQVFLRFSDRFSASGSYGMLATQGRRKMKIGDASIVYERPGILRVAGYFEGTDAAILLYTPYLIDLPHEARLYRITGSYTDPSRWQFQASYRALAISDGNKGSDLQLRFGRLLNEELSAGYEYIFQDYVRQAPWVPFTDHAKQLYYTPHNVDSHSLWVSWQAQKDQEVAFSLAGRLGYLPAYRSALREISGDLHYRASSVLMLNGGFSVGNTHREDAGYNYISFVMSLYVSVL